MNASPPRFRRHRATALVVFGLVAACEPSPRVIGVSTGPQYLDAARLAIADALASGPIQGFDTVMSPEGGNLAAPAVETATLMLSTAGMIAVVGHSNSAASLAAAPIYGRNEVVQISPTASAVVYSEAGPYSFRLVPPDDRQGDFLAGWLTEMLPDGGRLAVFYVNDDYGRGLRRALLRSLDGSTLEVVVDLPHMEDNVQDRDVANGRAALAGARPDAIVWLARGTVLDVYLDAIRQVLPGVPIVGGDAVDPAGVSAPFTERYAGVRTVAFVDMGASEELRAFGERYARRYGRPASGADALTYDAVMLLVAGLRAGARTGPSMRAYLVSLGGERPPFVGITGPIQFDEAGDVDRSYRLVGLGPTGTP